MGTRKGHTQWGGPRYRFGVKFRGIVIDISDLNDGQRRGGQSLTVQVSCLHGQCVLPHTLWWTDRQTPCQPLLGAGTPAPWCCGAHLPVEATGNHTEGASGPVDGEHLGMRLPWLLAEDGVGDDTIVGLHCIICIRGCHLHDGGAWGRGCLGKWDAGGDGVRAVPKEHGRWDAELPHGTGSYLAELPLAQSP